MYNYNYLSIRVIIPPIIVPKHMSCIVTSKLTKEAVRSEGMM